MSKWGVVMFLLCWELMWGCWLQSMVVTPMQTCMNINDAYFGKSEISFDVHVRMAFIQFNIWTLFDC